MAKLSIIQDIGVYCDKCDMPLEAYQDPKTHDLSISPCKGCAEKYKKAFERLIKRKEAAC